MKESRTITIPFLGYWKEKMLSGKKTCTSRTKKYGNVGDKFKVFNTEFELTDVKQVTLKEVGDKYYKQEGCDSLAQFVKIWSSIHYNRGFVLEQVVWLHTFKIVG